MEQLGAALKETAGSLPALLGGPVEAVADVVISLCAGRPCPAKLRAAAVAAAAAQASVAGVAGTATSGTAAVR